MTSAGEFPSFKDLPVTPGAPPNSAWGVWGPDDQIGTLNQLTDERTLQAVTEVRTGRVFNLNLPLDEPWRPPGSRRGNPRHYIQWVGQSEYTTEGQDDFSTTPADALVQGRDDYMPPSTCRAAASGTASPTSATPSTATTTGCPTPTSTGAREPGSASTTGPPGAWWGGACWPMWPATASRRAAPSNPAATTPSPSPTLQETLAHQGVEIRPGDILLIHTGWMHNYRNADEDYQRSAYTPAGLRTPGLATGEDMLEYLWDLQLAAIAADNTSLEYVPADDGQDWLQHRTILPLWGMAVGESWSLHDLAADCADDGQYSFFLVSVPLNIRGALGSPSNAVAIK